MKCDKCGKKVVGTNRCTCGNDLQEQSMYRSPCYESISNKRKR